MMRPHTDAVLRWSKCSSEVYFLGRVTKNKSYRFQTAAYALVLHTRMSEKL